MIRVKAVKVIRDKSKAIMGYELQDSKGMIKKLSSAELKSAIRKGKIEVINLTLTRDNRLIRTKDKAVNQKTKGNIGVNSITKVKKSSQKINRDRAGAHSVDKLTINNKESDVVLLPAPVAVKKDDETKYISMGSKERFNTKNLSKEEILAKIKESEENNVFDICIKGDDIVLCGVDFDKANEGNIDTIYIPYGITCIEDPREKFRHIESLNRIIIPDTVCTLGYECFCDCKALSKIVLPNSIKELRDGCFKGCSSLEKISIPESVKCISDECFECCTSLWDVEIPNSVTKIGNDSFAGCKSLNVIDIPDSVVEIGNSSFAGCTDLTDVNIPSSVTSIGYDCFYNCEGLGEVEIPDSVTEIGHGCFYSHYAQHWFTVRCNKGSYAEKYCREHGLQDVLVINGEDEN